MIHFCKTKGSFIVECDTCTEFLDTECDYEDGFNRAVEISKESDWKSFNKGCEWQHSCPSCFEIWLENKKKREGK